LANQLKVALLPPTRLEWTTGRKDEGKRKQIHFYCTFMIIFVCLWCILHHMIMVKLS